MKNGLSIKERVKSGELTPAKAKQVFIKEAKKRGQTPADIKKISTWWWLERKHNEAKAESKKPGE